MRDIEQANSQRQKAKWWSPVGDGSGGQRVIAEYKALIWEHEKISGHEWCQQLHNNVNVLNATKMYT